MSSGEEMKRPSVRFTIALIIVALFVVSDLTRRYLPSRARRALPESATDVHEKWMGLGFLGDFSRILKAKVTEEEFYQFAKRIGAETKYNPDIHDGDVGIHIMGPEWWDEPKNVENCFFIYKPEHDYVCRVQYRNGYAYFTEFKW